MKRYSEKSNRWTKEKALDFFLNFIQNHKEPINDNDTFDLISGLESQGELVKRIKSVFSKKKLNQLESIDNRRDRLTFDDDSTEILREIWCDKPSRPALRKMFSAMISENRKELQLADYSDEVFPQKVMELQKTFGLSDFEIDILLVLAFLRNGLLQIADGHNRCTDEADKVTFVAKCLDCDRTAVLGAVGENGKLRRYGCIECDLDFNGQIYGFLNGINEEPLASHFFTLQKENPLPWDFYGDLAEKHGEIIKKIICAGKGKSSVNILLYGAPGTGKTSFAKTLASELGLRCYFINQNSGDDGRTRCTPEHRFGALQICNDQIESAESLIVVDEADDMLRGNSIGGYFVLFGMNSMSCGDKGLLNSVLDSVKTPTIWITNTPAGALDESSRRRFDYSVRFEPLSSAQRLSIWKNNISKMKLNELFDDDMLNTFSDQYAVSAGGITLTLQNMAKLAPAKSEVKELVEKLLTPHCELLGISSSVSKLAPAKDYSLDGLNIKGDIPLERIVTAIRNFQNSSDKGLDRPRMNLLLSGEPGTGKTEFVKYLGQVLNTKITVCMGSDLLDMYVGGTEQNIKRAFTKAESEHSILFLDEIDGLVQSRERAMRNWEVTQVNELLHQMENFNGIMIGATNFSANLDSAILRRFTFKLEFDYLDDAGKVIFFERTFQSKLTNEEKIRLLKIPMLAPGDFRTVRQSLFYLGSSITNAERLSSLEQESNAKMQNRFSKKSKMGF